MTGGSGGVNNNNNMHNMMNDGDDVIMEDTTTDLVGVVSTSEERGGDEDDNNDMMMLIDDDINSNNNNDSSIMKSKTNPPGSPSGTTENITANTSTGTTATTNNNNINMSEGETIDAKEACLMLRSDDLASRINAATKIEQIAHHLGPKRTREELIPFITESVDDEDEVLVPLASSLGKLMNYVGGISQYAVCLLAPLELLLTVEETLVRERALDSARLICDKLPSDIFLSQFVDMMTRLAQKEWFTSRMSASCLIAYSFPRLKQQSKSNNDSKQTKKTLLLTLFAQLCRDDVPMVRRIASQNLGVLVWNVSQTMGLSSILDGENQNQAAVIPSILLPLYEELAVYDQDSVRLQTTENCVYFGNAMTHLSKQITSLSQSQSQSQTQSQIIKRLIERILPLLVSSIDDRSWRVRWTCASKFASVVLAFSSSLLLLSEKGGDNYCLNALIPAYEKLLQDPEAEVRSAATLNLAKVAQCNQVITIRDGGGGNEDGAMNMNSNNNINETSNRNAEWNTTQTTQTTTTTTTVAERLVKRVSALTEDESEHVRASLAMVATDLAPILGKDDTISYLVPPVLLLLRDSAPEVRLNLISSLGGLNQVIGVDLLSQSLLPAILDLAQDPKWRIRLAIMEHIPLLAKQLGKDFFSEQLSQLCVSWLGDNISSIRTAAAKNLQNLTILFGGKWASQYLIPAIQEDISEHPSYLRRLTAVQACALMMSSLSSSSSVNNSNSNAKEEDRRVLQNKLLPILIFMSKDEVPNVRFNVAKGLELVAQSLNNNNNTNNNINTNENTDSQHIKQEQIRPVLEVLMKDVDRDVRFFSQKAMRALDEEDEQEDPTNNNKKKDSKSQTQQETSNTHNNNNKSSTGTGTAVQQSRTKQLKPKINLNI